MAAASDVVLVDLGWPYNGLFNRAGEYLEIPDWINMAVELADEWQSVVRNFRQSTRNNDLRLIRRNEYYFDVTKDERLIERFYDDMYVPFVTSKHSHDPVIAPRRHVIRRARKGQLLRVWRGDDVLAAGVIFPEDGILYFLWMGIAPACLENPPEGAISALYYFGIQYAFDNDYEIVDFTGTRSFLKDGALRFKRKWGAFVDDTFSPNSILLKPRNGSDRAVLFCQQFPMLARTAGGLEAVFLWRDAEIDADGIALLKKQYACDGVSRITVIEIANGNAISVPPSSIDGCQYRVIRCRIDNFADHYSRHALST
jgi:hypothetical protein